MTILKGTEYSLLDGKGRFAIPAAHRKALLPETADEKTNGSGKGGKGKVVMTRHPGGFVILMSTEGWKSQEDALKALPDRGDSGGLKACMLGGVSEVEVDETGRTLLTLVLRKYLGIDLDKAKNDNERYTLAVVGVGGFIKISLEENDDACVRGVQERYTRLHNDDFPEEWNGISIL